MVQSNSYVPHPATLAYRVIAHLKTLPQGKQVASKPLADAVGTDTATLAACLFTARKYGAIRSEKRNGLLYWSLGDGVALAPPEKDTAPMQHKVVPAAASCSASLAVNIDDVHRSHPAPANDRVPEPAPEPAPKPMPEYKLELPPDVVTMGAKGGIPAPFSFSWRSDGELTITKDGGSVTISADEAGKIQRFLLRIGTLEL